MNYALYELNKDQMEGKYGFQEPRMVLQSFMYKYY